MDDLLGQLNNVVTQLCSWASNENLSEAEKLAIVAALSPTVASIVVPVVIRVNTESNDTPHALVARYVSQNAEPLMVVSEVPKPERFCPPPNSCDAPEATKPALLSSWAQTEQSLPPTHALPSEIFMDHAHQQNDTPLEDTSGMETESEVSSDSDCELMSVSDHGGNGYDANEEDVLSHAQEQLSIDTTASNSTTPAIAIASVTPNATPTHTTHTTHTTNHADRTFNFTTPSPKRNLADSVTDTTQHTTTSSAKRQRYKTDQYNPGAPVRVADEQIYKLSDKHTKESGTTHRSNSNYLQDLKHYYDRGWKSSRGKGEHKNHYVYVNPKGVRYCVLTGPVPVLGVDFFLTALDAWEYCKLHYVPVNPLPMPENVASGSSGF